MATMATTQQILILGLSSKCARSGLLISSKKWLLAEGGLTVWVDIGFLYVVVYLFRFENNPASSTQYPPSVVMKLDVEGRLITLIKN